MYAICLYILHCTHTNTHIYTVELDLSGLSYTASHPEVQNIWIIGIFFEIGYIGSLNVGCCY